jgi:hypothetical protein
VDGIADVASLSALEQPAAVTRALADWLTQ